MKEVTKVLSLLELVWLALVTLNRGSFFGDPEKRLVETRPSLVFFHE